MTSDDQEAQQRMSDLRKLLFLERGSDLAHQYMMTVRQECGSRVHDLDADVLLGLAEALAKVHAETLAEYTRYVKLNLSPVIKITDIDINIDDWSPAPWLWVKRDDVTCLDFFRAFWRRLTRPPAAR